MQCRIADNLLEPNFMKNTQLTYFNIENFKFMCEIFYYFIDKYFFIAKVKLKPSKQLLYTRNQKNIKTRIYDHKKKIKLTSLYVRQSPI